MVLTSRTRAFHGALTDALPALESYVLQPMSRPEVARFLRLWFGAVHAPDEKKAEEAAAALAREIEVHRELSRMSLNPNILTLIAILKFTRTRLPDRRVELYSDIIDLFPQRKDLETGANEAWQQLGLEVTLSEKRLLVARLALEMHKGGSSKDQERERGRTVPRKQVLENLAGTPVRSAASSRGWQAVHIATPFRSVTLLASVFSIGWFVLIALPFHRTTRPFQWQKGRGSSPRQRRESPPPRTRPLDPPDPVESFGGSASVRRQSGT